MKTNRQEKSRPSGNIHTFACLDTNSSRQLQIPAHDSNANGADPVQVKKLDIKDLSMKTKRQEKWENEVHTMKSFVTNWLH